MKAMAVSAFKAHALQAVDRVAKTRESLVVTKRGKALVRVVPYQPISSAPVSGKLAEALVFEKDIVSPLGAELWEASR
jgi:prevent-host-death family protein